MEIPSSLSRAVARGFRGVFLARRFEHDLRVRLTGGEPAAAARSSGAVDVPDGANSAPRSDPSKPRRRNILFITVDQQRFDALGVNGGRVARTHAIDGLARAGVNYRRAHVQSIVCMPSRSTMLTGQHPLTHGVVSNGVALPDVAPSVADHLSRRAGYRTALIGKAHFDPHLDPSLRFRENRLAAERSNGPWHGFEHVELATHGPMGGHHYAEWLWREHPAAVRGFAGVLTATGGGDTGAPEVAHNPIERGAYHTDWVADRTLAWLRARERAEPWFCWMSFPDPHHPFDPPYGEVRNRVDWHDLAMPEGRPGTREQIEEVLAGKPRHWLEWYRGRFHNPEGGPTRFVPERLTEDQLREVHAMIHVENELIDEACARVFAWLRESGADAYTDVIYTSDHGELQGDFGLLFKGPYHVDALMRVPLVWRPAPIASRAPCEVDTPVGLVDLAPTFCAIAGLEVPSWMQGRPLPVDRTETRERVITTFDSQFTQVGMHLRTIYRDGLVCTVYEPSTPGVGGGKWPVYWAVWNRGGWVPRYDGSEGELYDCANDPRQWRNLWNDPSRRRVRDDLVDDLRKNMPAARETPLAVSAPT